MPESSRNRNLVGCRLAMVDSFRRWWGFGEVLVGVAADSLRLLKDGCRLVLGAMCSGPPAGCRRGGIPACGVPTLTPIANIR